jgi:putative aldouronate transport system substrate-binding protein
MAGGYYIILDQFGDTRLMAPVAQLGAKYLEHVANFERDSMFSPAFGFTFDSTAYANELAACNAVRDEFFAVIDCGAADPDAEIPKFVDKLKAAGLDRLLAAKQEQLDAWVAANGKRQ